MIDRCNIVVKYTDDKINTSVKKEDQSIKNVEDKTSIIFHPEEKLNTISREEHYSINAGEQINIIHPISEHNKLKNLDFEHSGHTGFASEKQLIILKNEVVPKKLNLLPSVKGTSNRMNLLLYVDNQGTPEKISVSNMLSKIIRTSNQIPEDLQKGVYLFLEKEDNNGF